MKNNTIVSENKTITKISCNESLEIRNIIPSDFHWDELTNMFLEGKIKYYGEIYCVSKDKYYSALAGKKYKVKTDEKHLDEGHFQAYRFAIQNFTNEGDWVFDPTVGSGTAIIEAINNNRNAIGIELEYPNICKQNVEEQQSLNNGICIHGNAKDLCTLLPEYQSKFGQFSLILNGTPYPVLNGKKSSDAPERLGSDGPDNYYHPDSFGLLKWNTNYESFISAMYVDSLKYLKIGGRFITIIKDPIQNKKPFLLQKYITEWVLRDNPGMILEGFFLHKHVPETYFIRTYRKRFPDVKIPLYQVGLILKKEK